MGATVLAVVQGEPRGEPIDGAPGSLPPPFGAPGSLPPPFGAPGSLPGAAFRDRAGTVLPILVLFGLVLLLGIWIPPGLDAAVRDAARFVEARP
jgi:hypothetical protein